jgi:hypothetical protein
MPRVIPDIERALSAVGELLSVEGKRVHVVIVGGAALNLLRIVQRSTRDVDVLAIARPRPGSRRPKLRHPDPLPAPLRRAAAAVARDLDLPPDWLNTDVAGQWETGLPQGLERRVHWHSFAGLKVGVVDRRDLIFFKLYAATDDRGPQSVHYQDLLALRPTEAELAAAARWVRRQDPSPAFAHELGGLLEHVRRHAR